MEVIILVLLLLVAALVALGLWQVGRGVRHVPAAGSRAYAAWGRFFDRHLWNRNEMKKILGDDLTDRLG